MPLVRPILLAVVAIVLTVWLTMTPTPPRPEPAASAELPSALDALDASHPLAWGNGAEQRLSDDLQPRKVNADLPIGRLVGLVRGAGKRHDLQATSSDGPWVLQANAEGTRLLDQRTGAEIVRLHDYRTAEPPPPAGPAGFPGLILPTLPHELRSWDRLLVKGLALSSDGRRLVLSGRREVKESLGSSGVFPWLQAWTWEQNTLTPSEMLLRETGVAADLLAISPDGSLFAAGRNGGNIATLYDLADNKITERKTITLPGNKLRALAFAPDERTLAVAVAADVHLFDLAPALPGFRQWWKTWAALTIAVGLLLIAWVSAVHCGLTHRVDTDPGLWMWLAPVGLAIAGTCLVLALLRWLTVPSPIPLTVLSGARKVKQMAFSPSGDQLAVLHAGLERRIVVTGKESAVRQFNSELLVYKGDPPEQTHAMTLPWDARAISFAQDGRHLLIEDAEGSRYVLRLYPFDEAGAILKRCDAVLREHPENVAALVCRAQVLLSKGRLDDALADLNAALRHEPKNALAHYHRGRVYLEKEEYQLARKDFTRAVSLDPKLDR